jgi:cardiolipin synthase
MEYLYWICYILYIIIDAIVMIKVVMDNRQPAKTMAWILVLWALPVVGILLYIFFGQNTRKERLISERSLSQLTKRSMFEYIEQKDLRLPESHRPLMLLFKNQSMALPFKDNDVTLYTSGYEFFPALLHEISLAQHHIHIDIFIFEDDELGNLIADALIDRAEHGVEVRVVYDDVGCWKVKNSFYERMRNAGIDVHPFMPVKFPAFTSKANYRNHRKIIVIDGKVGFIGGMNFATRYVKGTGTQPWRDTMMRITGGAVYGLQRAFLIDWYFVDRTLITSRDYYPTLDPDIHNNCVAQVVTSSPVTEWPDIMQGYVRILLEAKRYVYIETPYFLPTEPVLFALRTAALAGVDVRIIIPMHSDTRVVEWASVSYVKEVIEADVKVYLYQAGFNHSKFMVSDDSICTCGSTNVDFRSFEHDFEANVFFYDEGLALRMKKMFMDDEAVSPLATEVYAKTPFPFRKRLWASIVRLLSPLL